MVYIMRELSCVSDPIHLIQIKPPAGRKKIDVCGVIRRE